MSVTNYPTVPAVYSSRSVTPRNIFKSGTPEYLPSLATIDGTKSRDTSNSPVSVLQAGLLMGKITTGGKYRPATIGLLGSAYTSGGTSLTVSAAVATECARLIVLAAGNISLKAIGPPSAAGTVALTSVTCSAASGTTLTVADLGVNKAAGSIIAPADGAQTPIQVVTPQYGVPVTDEFAASLDQTMRLLRGGDIDVTQIPFYSTMDTSVQSWVKAALNGVGIFTFSDDR
jgi:hypothetical protein